MDSSSNHANLSFFCVSFPWHHIRNAFVLHVFKHHDGTVVKDDGTGSSVSTVLLLWSDEGLGGVVGIDKCRNRHDLRAALKHQMRMALQSYAAIKTGAVEGSTTVPPPLREQEPMAALMVGESSVLPSPLAPSL